MVEVDLLESNHPTDNTVVLLAPYVSDMEVIKHIIVVRELAGAARIALACGVY